MAWLALGLGFALTLFAWQRLHWRTQEYAREMFERECQLAVLSIERSTQFQLQRLRALQKLFHGAPQKREEEWNRYTRLGLGAFVASAHLPDFSYAERGTNREGQDVFTVRFATPRWRYASGAQSPNPIHRSGQTLSILPEFREAIARTRDSGQPAASCPFLLPQSESNRNESAVVCCLAVYRDRVPASLDGRRAAFDGLLFCILNPVRAIPPNSSRMDTNAMFNAAFLSQDASDPAPLFPPLDRTVRFRTAGQTWPIHISPTKEFMAKVRDDTAGLMLAAGLGFSLLCFRLLRLQVHRRLEAERATAEVRAGHDQIQALAESLELRVHERTTELSETNAHLRREITSREQAEEDLRGALAAEKELRELKSRFVSMVSHEFRTPLGNIQSSAELLCAYFDRLPAERRERLLRGIVESTRDMAQTMEEVLLLSRVEAASYQCQPECFNLAGFLRGMASEAQSVTGQPCQIHLTLEELPERAWADCALLRHIFSNLLSNAVKYSPPGATVEFTIRRDGPEAVFQIRDHGIGIPNTDLNHLFNAFYRGSNTSGVPGTGLGLVVVKRCVELHHGRIVIESEQSNGTLATVRLPLFAK